MRRFIFILVVVLAVVGISVIISQSLRPTYQPEYTGGARLQVAQDTLDFGQIKYDVPVEAVFNLQNIGDEPLLIVREPVVELIEGC